MTSATYFHDTTTTYYFQRRRPSYVRLIIITIFSIFFITRHIEARIEKYESTSRLNHIDEHDDTVREEFLKRDEKSQNFSLYAPINGDRRTNIRGGLKPIPKYIVNGVESKPHRYPYLVSVFTGVHNKHICGASLIAPTVVLCASHCVHEGKATYVQIGNHDKTDITESIETINVLEFTLHPKWNRKTFNYDVAVLLLEKASTRDPVKVMDVSDNYIVGEDLTVMGWGDTEYNGKKSSILRETDVDHISDYNCIQKFGNLITDSMFCAMRNGTDACQGDSGGPAIRKGTHANNDVQVGIVSWGFQCAHPFYPGVYTRLNIPEIREFIDKSLCKYSPTSCQRFAKNNCGADRIGHFLAPGDSIERSCLWVSKRKGRCRRYYNYCPHSCCGGNCDKSTGLCPSVYRNSSKVIIDLT